MHGVQLHTFSLEPVAQLFDVFPVRVIEMAVGSKDFDRLRAAALHGIEQPRMQALLDVNVRGHCAQHQKPTAFPPLRPSGAPSRSPVLASMAMHSPSLQ